ncbi:MAG: diacylglycerol kinase family lipid kinase [Chloroflexi bacterium]|nr:diacylglycerol kinase family lipid kinase [Chloroflexota bacterium]
MSTQAAWIPGETPASRLGYLAAAATQEGAVLIFNPHAGQKLGINTNSGSIDDVQDALREQGISVDPWPTQAAGHATALARQAAKEGRPLVVAAGGDGTVAEVAHGLAGTQVPLGVMPLGSVMNVARTLCIPRELAMAARVIADGQTLRMDVGRQGEHHFLEAAGVGLDAGLFRLFNRIDRGNANPLDALRSGMRFLTRLGQPRLIVLGDGRRLETRAPMVVAANAKVVGAAYMLAPDARIDDGLLDVVVFRGASVPRLLLHLLATAGGRKVPPPPRTQTFRARSVEIRTRRALALPVHVDGEVRTSTPVQIGIEPAALTVVVGTPDPDALCAWDYASVPVPTTIGEPR